MSVGRHRCCSPCQLLHSVDLEIIESLACHFTLKVKGIVHTKLVLKLNAPYLVANAGIDYQRYDALLFELQ